MEDPLDIDDNAFLTVVRNIHAVPIRRETTCIKCNSTYSYLTMHIYVCCPECGHNTKTRAFSSAFEPQEIIGTVLAWLANATPSERDEMFANHRKWFDAEWLEDQPSE